MSAMIKPTDTVVVCTWLHYWQRDGRLQVLLRLTVPICTGDLMFDFPQHEEWVYA